MIKAFFTPLTWKYDQPSGYRPGRSVTGEDTDTVLAADFVDVSEFPAPFIDSLNNEYDTTGHKYELPIVSSSDKITVYFPYYKDSVSFTIHDVVLDINCEFGVGENNRFIITNVEPITGDLVFSAVAPTTAQGNNPSSGAGDINADRGTIGIYNNTQVRFTPDYTLQRTTISGVTNNAGIVMQSAPFFSRAYVGQTQLAQIHKYYYWRYLIPDVATTWGFEEVEEN